jgi:hypothetical protein
MIRHEGWALGMPTPPRKFVVTMHRPRSLIAFLTTGAPNGPELTGAGPHAEKYTAREAAARGTASWCSRELVGRFTPTGGYPPEGRKHEWSALLPVCDR